MQSLSQALMQLNPGVAVILIVFASIVAGTAVKGWFRFRRAQLDADLKRDMIARGMSAEEIVQVLAGKSGKDRE